MNLLRKVLFCFAPVAGLFSFTVLVLVFPGRVAAGAAQGLARCCTVMVPALFPFLVVSQCLAAASYSRALGGLFSPLAHLYKVPRAAGTALLLSGLGGFAPGCAYAGRLHRAGELSDWDAAILACGCATVSPAFAVTVIGERLLGSVSMGWLFFLILYFSNLLCTFAVSKLRKDPTARQPHPQPKTDFSLVEAVNAATRQMLQICGFVILFAILAALTAPTLSSLSDGVWYGLLELSAGVNAAAALSKLFPAMVACCTLGACGLLQMRALLPAQVPLWPALLTRPVHLALSWALLQLALRFLPGDLAVWAGGRRLVAVCRLPWQSGCFFFLFVALGCRLVTQHRIWQKEPPLPHG